MDPTGDVSVSGPWHRTTRLKMRCHVQKIWFSRKSITGERCTTEPLHLICGNIHVTASVTAFGYQHYLPRLVQGPRQLPRNPVQQAQL